jgi:hypothetical protein
MADEKYKIQYTKLGKKTGTAFRATREEAAKLSSKKARQGFKVTYGKVSRPPTGK